MFSNAPKKRVSREIIKDIESNKEKYNNFIDAYTIIFLKRGTRKTGKFQVYIYRNKWIKLIGRAFVFINGQTDSTDNVLWSKVSDNLDTLIKEENGKVEILGNKMYYRNLKNLLLLNKLIKKTNDLGNFSKKQCTKKEYVEIIPDNPQLFNLDVKYKFTFSKDVKEDEFILDVGGIKVVKNVTCADILNTSFFRIDYSEDNPSKVDICRVENGNRFYYENSEVPSKVIYMFDKEIKRKDSIDGFYKRYRMHDVFSCICKSEIRGNLKEEINSLEKDRKEMFEYIVKKINIKTSLYNHYKTNNIDDNDRKILNIIYEIIKNIRNNTLIILDMDKYSEFLDKENDYKENDKKNILEEIVRYGKHKNRYFECKCIFIEKE